ncbi:hypothetical protein DDT52_17695 [Brenneria roseae subsp. roseae]|uniref:hypothetical protein n=1 Tax=Brenneria roseae TaxID=1509241 RepID=UPI000D604A46|nr:hypothetical protein [Brenneria roseae]PWC16633.1 hypothetical protein DDT52_17695 [Brenneria roseae subsp. roseae]
MTNPMLNWTVWISQPFWILAIAQVALMTVFILLGNWLVLGEVRQEMADVEQQIGEHSLGIQNIQQQLATMPSLADMQTQLTAWTTGKTPFHVDRVAQLATEPLSRSGAVLLSWQPAVRKSTLIAEETAWILTFRSDYQGLLNVVRQFIALPYVLRMDQLVVKSTESPSYTDRALHVEMTVMRPTIGRSKKVE